MNEWMKDTNLVKTPITLSHISPQIWFRNHWKDGFNSFVKDVANSRPETTTRPNGGRQLGRDVSRSSRDWWIKKTLTLIFWRRWKIRHILKPSPNNLKNKHLVLVLTFIYSRIMGHTRRHLKIGHINVIVDQSIIVRILNLYIILLCTHLYHSSFQ